MNGTNNWIWIAYLIGPILGVAGAVVGSYFSIKNTHGPRERAFVIKGNLTAMFAVLLYLGLLLFIPTVWKWCLTVPFMLMIFPCARRWNLRQDQIRKEELQNKPAHPSSQGSQGGR